MRIKNIFIVPILMICFFGFVIFPNIFHGGAEIWFSSLFFLLISIFVEVSVIRLGNLEDNLIAIYGLGFYFVYMTMSSLYMIYNAKATMKEISILQVIVGLASVLVYIGIRIGNRLRVSTFSFLKRRPTMLTYCVLLLLVVVVRLLEMRAAGGIVAFFRATYQGKFSSVSTEKMIGGITKIVAPFTYYNLLYIDKKNGQVISYVAKTYFLLNLLYTYASGSSLAILYQLIALCCVMIFKQNNNGENIVKEITKKQKKWIRMAIILTGIGIVAAILIRFNRASDTFSFDVLKEAYKLISTTSTFDSMYYLFIVLNNLVPQFTVGQFIFPFIFWLPRSIFPFKPVELGRIVATTFRGFNDNINGGYAVTPIAEFYYDFSIIGVILGMLFIGILIGVIQKKIRYSDNRQLGMVVTLMFMFATGSLATSWSAIGSNYVSILIFMTLASVLNRCRIGGK